MYIDLGGRINANAGWQTLDSKPPADFVHDLGTPLPFKDGEVDMFRAHHILEHIHDLCGLMDELWRCLKPGGMLDIEVPHVRHGAAFHDPTHVRYFTECTFDYFVRLTYFGYVKHYWEFFEEPKMVGANKDCLALTLRKPL